MEKQAITANTIFDERYEILEIAGEGGMGTVYRARHTGLDRIVAIKVMRKENCADADSVRRFQHEAQMAKALQHPHIAAVQNFGVFNDQPYIVFDFLEGEGLEKLLARERKLSFAQFVGIFQQVCDALGYAHQQGVIHRDIKPSNIFLRTTADGRDDAQVLDFGIAKAINPVTQTGGQRLTVTGTVLGTPLYMSPEQGRGEKVAYTSDVYSLACLMYQACFGQPPFNGDSAYQILFSHTYDEPALDTVPAGYPEGILDLLRKGLAKSPNDRYATAVELGQSLAEVTKQKVSASATKIPVRPADKAAGKQVEVVSKRRVPKLVAITVLPVVVVCLLGFAAFQFGNLRQVGGGSASREQIEAEWQKSHDSKKLRDGIKGLMARNLDDTCAFVQELRDDLFVHADLNTAGIFFDIADRLGASSKAAKDWIHQGAFALRLCPEEVWINQKQEALDQVVMWADDQSANPSAEDTSKQLVFFGGISLLDGKPLAAKCVIDKAIARLSKQETVRGDTARALRDVADQFGRKGQNDTALKLLSLINLPDTTARLPVCVLRANLFDSWSDPQSALTDRRAAYQMASKSNEIDPAIIPGLLQSMADDELATNDVESAGKHYAMVSDLINRMPYDEVRWSSLLRLADAYSVMKKTDIARKLYAQGLSEAQKNSNAAKKETAQIYVAQFAWHTGDSKLAASILDRKHDWAREVPLYAESVTVSLQPAHALVHEQAQCRTVLNDLKGDKRAAGVKAEQCAEDETTAAEWCLFRHDHRAAAEHHLAAAKLRATILGSSAVQNSVWAIRNFYEARAWNEVVVNAEKIMDNPLLEEENATPVMHADALINLGRIRDAGKILHHFQAQHLANRGSPLGMRAWMDIVKVDLACRSYRHVCADARAAYECAKEHRWTDRPIFREAGFLCLQAYNAAGKDTNAHDFVKDFYTQLVLVRKI